MFKKVGGIMKKMIVVMAATFLFGISSLANGEILEIELDCGGEYDLFDNWIMNLDLGVSFTEISNIYIDWSGEITGELSTFAGNEYPTIGVFSLLLYKMDPHVDLLAHTSVSGGLATYPEPEFFDTVQSLTNDGWETFYDGSAMAEINFNRGPRFGDFVVVPSSGVLNSAKLIVEGTLIPEPTSLLLIA